MRPLLALLAASLIAAPHASLAADARLQALFDSAWEADLQDNPISADYLGDHRFADRWPDLTPAAFAARYARYAATLAELKAIPRAGLSNADKLNYDLFALDFQRRLDAQPFKPWLYEVARPRDGVQTSSEIAELLPFATVADYEAWIARLTKMGAYIDENIALLETAIREKRTQPRSIMERVPAQIALQIPANAEDSPFFEPFKRFPDGIGAEDRARLIGEAGRAIGEQVIPAFRRLDAFMRDKYLPACRTSDGIWDTPDGAAFYANRVAYHTTTNLTPEEIHATGLREVARIRAEMDEVIRKVGFNGSFEEFLTFLRTDPQFYARTPEELLMVSSYVVNRVNAKIGDVIGTLPRRRFTVLPVPDAIAPYYTSGRGGLESCLMNTYDLPSRPLYNIPALTLHECVPGHSLQAALSEEGQELPAFRRQTYFSGFGEGWGLYSEWLGEEMGIYRTPYEHFGRLSYEMWRAARLVIDTGIHRYGWSRERAIEYLASHTALSQREVETEVDRYISWPGQALAYKLGELTIRRLRREAETALGERFDERRFHDAILALGSTPLPVLEQRIHRFIEEEQARAH